MKRAALVIAGTAAGTTIVLGFPTQKPTSTLPSTALHGASADSAAPKAGVGSPGGSAASSGTAAPPTTATGPRTATGTDQPYQFGDLAVRVTVSGGKITNVQIATLNETDGRSVQIDDYAIPQLEQQALAANSANIDGVSGATFTSEAFAYSLTSALSKLGFSG